MKIHMKNVLKLSCLIIVVITTACSNNNKSDAYGNFEADETIISSETNGKILSLNVDEGSRFNVNDLLCTIDTTQLLLKKLQLSESISALSSKTQDINSQLDVYDKKKSNLLREKNRIDNLFKDSATTKKQVDDINGELDIVDKQIIATRISMQTVNRGLLSEQNPLNMQIKQLQDQINRSYIIAPIAGTVLTKYIQAGEFATIGKPLFKIANLDELILRAYISGSQLSSCKLGQKVKVIIDKNNEQTTELVGEIYWISDKAEFTPKIIQTKEERVNLVYAIKIKVKNSGELKIGMPAEVKF
jgi:HlyD family secretion protein